MLLSAGGGYKTQILRVAVSEEMTDRSPAEARSPSNFSLADPLLKEPNHLGRVLGDRRGPPVRATLLAGLGDPGLHTVAEDLSLELGEDRERAGQGSVGGTST